MDVSITITKGLVILYAVVFYLNSGYAHNDSSTISHINNYDTTDHSSQHSSIAVSSSQRTSMTTTTVQRTSSASTIFPTVSGNLNDTSLTMINTSSKASQSDSQTSSDSTSMARSSTDYPTTTEMPPNKTTELNTGSRPVYVYSSQTNTNVDVTSTQTARENANAGLSTNHFTTEEFVGAVVGSFVSGALVVVVIGVIVFLKRQNMLCFRYPQKFKTEKQNSVPGEVDGTNARRTNVKSYGNQVYGETPIAKEPEILVGGNGVPAYDSLKKESSRREENTYSTVSEQIHRVDHLFEKVRDSQQSHVGYFSLENENYFPSENSQRKSNPTKSTAVSHAPNGKAYARSGTAKSKIVAKRGESSKSYDDDVFATLERDQTGRLSEAITTATDGSVYFVLEKEEEHPVRVDQKDLDIPTYFVLEKDKGTQCTAMDDKADAPENTYFVLEKEEDR